jgi:hypothetical protein
VISHIDKRPHQVPSNSNNGARLHDICCFIHEGNRQLKVDVKFAVSGIVDSAYYQMSVLQPITFELFNQISAIDDSLLV